MVRFGLNSNNWGTYKGLYPSPKIGEGIETNFITTGTFTRDGAPPIDLIDGEQLVQRLKELGIGVKIKMIESVEIDEDWYRKI